MSHLVAAVSQIEHRGSLHIVKFEFHGQTLTMMSLDLDPQITIGTKVQLVIKPSHIAIAKAFSGEVSYSNQLRVTIKSIEDGVLLSSIKLLFADTLLESVITADASRKMDLHSGEEVTVFIKASEISIEKVIGND